MNKQKEIKMTVDNYNSIMQQLDKIQLSSGIANAQTFLGIIQLLNKFEIIEENIVIEKKEKGEK